MTNPGAALETSMARMMESDQSDWRPGGRFGTKLAYDEGYRHTFGNRGIFKNLAPEELQDKKGETDED